MKHIIWDYKEGKYIEGVEQMPKEFDTEKDAEDYAISEAVKDVSNGIESDLIEARENGYSIEEISSMKHIIYTYKDKVYSAEKKWSFARAEKVLNRLGATYWEIG